MKRNEVLMSIMIVLMLIFGMVVPVAAQDGEMPVNCNGLSEADCAILTEAAQASQGQMLTSIAMPTISMNLSVQAGEESLLLSGSGSVRAVISEAVIAMLSDMSVSIADMSMETYDMDAIIAFYEQFDADMIVQILEGVGFAATLDEFTMQAPGESASLSGEAIFKDMGLYLHTSAPNGADAWFGEQLEITQDMKDELNAGLEEMIASMQDAELEGMMDQMGDMSELMLPLIELANSYVTVTRGADEELFGQTNYVFTTTFDLKGFLADETLPAAIMSIFENPMLMEMMGEEMDMEINETQVQFVLMTAGMLLGDVTISGTEWIGADDMLTHKIAADIAANVDLSLMGDPELTDATVSGSFVIEIDGYNSTTLDDVEIPTDYYSIDMIESFLAGGPAMIESELALGDTFSGSFTEDDTDDVYAITLSAGQSASLELESDEYLYLTVYGPDGFAIDNFDPYYDEDMSVDATADGLYLIKVEGYWEADYDLTVRAE